jgi:glycosyltransferase involved in cell wall biosynthesis
MIKSAHLQNKVILLGSLQHNEVRKVMVMGHIYLNTSLTEAFCIANVEAASCGLYVISADIGGVAEVLPDEMITLVNPDKISIIKGIIEAISKIDVIKSEINGKSRNYDILKNTYNADIVARKVVSFIFSEIILINFAKLFFLVNQSCRLKFMKELC